MTLTATATPQVKVQWEVASINQQNIGYHAYELKELPRKGTLRIYVHICDLGKPDFWSRI